MIHTVSDSQNSSNDTAHITTKSIFTVSEVADLLRVDDTTVRRWIVLGTLEAVILPHVNDRQSYRIKRETLVAMNVLDA